MAAPAVAQQDPGLLDRCKEASESIQRHYDHAESRAVKPLEKKLSERVYNTFLSIFRSLPESVAFIAASFMGTPGKLLASMFWAVKTVVVLTPLIKWLFSENKSKETLKAAWNEVKENLSVEARRLLPAFALACAATAVFGGVASFFLFFGGEIIKSGTSYAAIPVYAAVSYFIFNNLSEHPLPPYLRNREVAAPPEPARIEELEVEEEEVVAEGVEGGQGPRIEEAGADDSEAEEQAPVGEKGDAPEQAPVADQEQESAPKLRRRAHHRDDGGKSHQHRSKRSAKLVVEQPAEVERDSDNGRAPSPLEE